jgi:hypothetical protein
MGAMESLTTMQIALLLGFAGCLARRMALHAFVRRDPTSETLTAQSRIFQALTNLGFILGYVYVSEHTELFSRAPRLFHMPTYLISHVVFYGAVLLYPLKSKIARTVKGTMRDLRSGVRSGGGTRESGEEHELQALATEDGNCDKSSPPTSTSPAPAAKFEVPMNRAQTEEWKGWMQFEFVAYHIFAASSTYNSIRCYVSAYVWLTGFGNFTFFVSKGDYGAMRVGKMLWRLLFFCFLLCLVTNNNIFLYYIVPLHTFYFLVTYVVCGCYRAGNGSNSVLLAKLAILAAAIYALWDAVPATFDALFGFLFPLLGINPTWVYEWHFRTYLDHFSAVLGMCFAFKFPNYVQWVKDVEALPYGTQLLLKSLVWLFLAAALIAWGVLVFSKSKYEYNSYHPYFMIVPILFTIFTRNLTPWLRTHSFGLLSEMGKITLETYLLQANPSQNQTAPISTPTVCPSRTEPSSVTRGGGLAADALFLRSASLFGWLYRGAAAVAIRRFGFDDSVSPAHDEQRNQSIGAVPGQLGGEPGAGLDAVHGVGVHRLPSLGLAAGIMPRRPLPVIAARPACACACVGARERLRVCGGRAGPPSELRLRTQDAFFGRSMRHCAENALAVAAHVLPVVALACALASAHVTSALLLGVTGVTFVLVLLGSFTVARPSAEAADAAGFPRRAAAVASLSLAAVAYFVLAALLERSLSLHPSAPLPALPAPLSALPAPIPALPAPLSALPAPIPALPPDGPWSPPFADWQPPCAASHVARVTRRAAFLPLHAFRPLEP